MKKLALLFLLLATVGANAQLARVGPVNQYTFPAWYQDSTGLVLDACFPNATELVNLSCLIDGGMLTNPNSPIAFPGNFPDEFFYWDASSIIALPSGGSASVEMALEGAFANGPVVNGDQMVFARVRIRIDAPSDGDYRVIYPFGVVEFPGVVAGTRSINYTHDIGTAALEFSGALKGDITTFLRASQIAGGAPLPFVVLPGGNTFLADPAVDTFVTGSPFGTNYVRIEGPNVGGVGINSIESALFALTGRVHTAPIPSSVDVKRATYRRDMNGAQADIFATASAAIGVPDPVLSITGMGVRGTVMAKDAVTSTYYGQISPESGTTLPASVTVTNTSDVPNTSVTVPLVDEVVISSAVYNSNNQMLTIQASSGDKLDPNLTLVALGYGPIDPTTGTLVVQTALPPSEVTVVSNRNGRDTRRVTLTAQSIDAGAPFAANDVLVDDVPAETSTTINILANDVPSVGPRPRLLAQAQHGTVAIDELAGTATYTPNTGYSGPDSFSYINNYNGIDSNVALVSFNVGFVNLAPVVKDDASTVGSGTPVTIDVLANDTDPNVGDSLNPLTVTITSLPASGDVVVNPNGTVTYAPAPGTSGDFTFQYTVADSHGLVSPAANVTVTVLPADNLTNIQASYVAKDGRWRIRGSASIPGPGNTITIHIGNSLTGPILGTIGVDTSGAFDFSVRSSSIRPDATNTVSLESTKGGQQLGVPVQIQ